MKFASNNDVHTILPFIPVFLLVTNSAWRLCVGGVRHPSYSLCGGTRPIRYGTPTPPKTAALAYHNRVGCVRPAER